MSVPERLQHLINRLTTPSLIQALTNFCADFNFPLQLLYERLYLHDLQQRDIQPPIQKLHVDLLGLSASYLDYPEFMALTHAHRSMNPRLRESKSLEFHFTKSATQRIHNTAVVRLKKEAAQSRVHRVLVNTCTSDTCVSKSVLPMSRAIVHLFGSPADLRHIPLAAREQVLEYDMHDRAGCYQIESVKYTLDPTKLDSMLPNLTALKVEECSSNDFSLLPKLIQLQLTTLATDRLKLPATLLHFTAFLSISPDVSLLSTCLESLYVPSDCCRRIVESAKGSKLARSLLVLGTLSVTENAPDAFSVKDESAIDLRVFERLQDVRLNGTMVPYQQILVPPCLDTVRITTHTSHVSETTQLFTYFSDVKHVYLRFTDMRASLKDWVKLLTKLHARCEVVEVDIHARPHLVLSRKTRVPAGTFWNSTYVMQSIAAVFQS